jgi:hypothetical protein
METSLQMLPARRIHRDPVPFVCLIADTVLARSERNQPGYPDTNFGLSAQLASGRARVMLVTHLILLALPFLTHYASYSLRPILRFLLFHAPTPQWRQETGPLMTYMATCDKFKGTTARWFKID